jgi:hypothetical protein
MPARSHQISRLDEEAGDRSDIRNFRAPDSKGQADMAEALTLEHERNTDVMFADVRQPLPNVRIDVMDIGEIIGFPGQVHVRVQRAGDETVLLGLIIQNYSAFKKRVARRYRIISVRHAILLLVEALAAAFRIEHRELQAV